VKSKLEAVFQTLIVVLSVFFFRSSNIHYVVALPLSAVRLKRIPAILIRRQMQTWSEWANHFTNTQQAI
jgi:hypothetical protein